MNDNQMFLLADKLAELYVEKAVAEVILKDISADIKSVEYQLSAHMAESGLRCFIHSGTEFYLSETGQGTVSVKSAPVR